MKFHDEAVTIIDTIKNVIEKNAPNISSASIPLPNSIVGICSPKSTLMIMILMISIIAPTDIPQYNLLLAPLSFLRESIIGIASPTEPSIAVTNRGVDKKSILYFTPTRTTAE
jgi:hypothetical protein